MKKFIVEIKLNLLLKLSGTPCIYAPVRTHNKHSICASKHRLVSSECVQSPIHAYGHSYVGLAHLESFLSMYLCDVHTHARVRALMKKEN